MIPNRRGPTLQQLKRLQTLRLKAGLSLETVADRTGLPVAHVEALERGDLDELPSGPYVGAYYRLVYGVLGHPVEDQSEDESVPLPPERLPLWGVRLVALSSVAAVVLAGAWWISTREAGEVASELMSFSPPSEFDTVVQLTAMKKTTFSVIVDGEPSFNGAVPPGFSRTFEAKDMVRVELRGAEDVQIVYNGDPVRPQGRQGVARVLQFVDDRL